MRVRSLISLLLLLPALASAAASTTESPEAIAQAAQAFLQEQLSDLPGQASITMDPVKNDRLAACDVMAPFLPAAVRLRSRITVGVRCTAPQNWTTYVQATLSVPGQYYVASHQIAPGKTILDDDLATRDGDLVNLPPGALTDAKAIVGMQARHRITAGQPIKGSALRSPESISRGQNVRIVARGNGFVVSSEGQAMEDAPPGATIQVRTTSGQIVSGVVQNAGQVEVQL